MARPHVVVIRLKAFGFVCACTVCGRWIHSRYTRRELEQAEGELHCPVCRGTLEVLEETLFAEIETVPSCRSSRRGP